MSDTDLESVPADVVRDETVAVDSDPGEAGADEARSDEASHEAGVDQAGSDRPEPAADDAAAGEESSGGLLVQEGDIAADYLERLLDIIDFDGDIDLDVENDRAVVAIVGSGLRSLIGPRGEVLDALQDLTRLAVTQQTGQRSRLMLDISGYRQGRRAELVALASETAIRVIASGEAVRLAPMNPFERKMVHDAIGGIEGVRSESEGVEPERRVVVLRDA